MGRRARGDGPVYYDAARGCWVGAIDLGHDAQTGRRIRRKVSAPTKMECRDKLDALRAEKQGTGTVARRDTTVEHVVADWLAHPPPEIRSPISRRVHRDAGARIVKAIGPVKVVTLSAAQVERLLSGMVRDGYATSTIAATRSALVRAVRRAQRDGLVARNVAELVPCPRGTRRESRSMSVAQVGQLLRADLTPWWRAYLFHRDHVRLAPWRAAGAPLGGRGHCGRGDPGPQVRQDS
jgi:hypothetical protein